MSRAVAGSASNSALIAMQAALQARVITKFTRIDMVFSNLPAAQYTCNPMLQCIDSDAVARPMGDKGRVAH